MDTCYNCSVSISLAIATHLFFYIFYGIPFDLHGAIKANGKPFCKSSAHANVSICNFLLLNEWMEIVIRKMKYYHTKYIFSGVVLYFGAFCSGAIYLFIFCWLCYCMNFFLNFVLKLYYRCYCCCCCVE